jgi:small-conductance mechanosensitive channel
MFIPELQRFLTYVGLSETSVITVALSLLLSFIVYRVIFGLIRLWGKKTSHRLPMLLDKYFFYPGLFLFLLMGAMLSFPVIRLSLDRETMSSVRHITYLLLVINTAFLLIRLIYFTGDLTNHYFDDTQPDNLRARKFKTRFNLIQKILTFMIILIAFGVAIMSFEKIRAIGTTILASAGILSIIVGFAAQKSLATFIAGIQIAITQPIRHDDVVIVEGEWGRIEEITLTYIVVRIWDERRLVLPINYFLEKPFQNWTRTRADLLGTVTLYADYTLPVEPLRAELTRILSGHPLWDGLVNVLQVTDATDHAMQIRALVSARNSAEAFDLRCDVREKLITFIQKNYPECLPHARIIIREKDLRKEASDEA